MLKQVKTIELRSWCERPDVGYLDDFVLPDSQALIIGKSPNSDIVVNSIIYNFVQKNYQTYLDNGWDIQVVHEHAQPIVDLEFGSDGKFDYTRPDLLFITLDPGGGEMTPKGIGKVIGKLLLCRKTQNKPVYLVSAVGGETLFRHYSIAGVDFSALLRGLKSVLAVDQMPKAPNGV